MPQNIAPRKSPQKKPVQKKIVQVVETPSWGWRVLKFLLRTVSYMLVFFLIIWLVQVPAVASVVQDTTSNILDFLGVPYQQQMVSEPTPEQPPKPLVLADELELEVHILTNIEREKFGLEPVGWDNELRAVARLHSRDMAERDFFEHVNPDNCDPTCRAEALGYYCTINLPGGWVKTGVSENIFKNNLHNTTTYYTTYNKRTSEVYNVTKIYNWNSPQEISKSTVEGWMNSPGHRNNILNDNVTLEGIGVHITEEYKVYITQNFC